jgi:hypothetical protein
MNSDEITMEDNNDNMIVFRKKQHGVWKRYFSGRKEYIEISDYVKGSSRNFKVDQVNIKISDFSDKYYEFIRLGYNEVDEAEFYYLLKGDDLIQFDVRQKEKDIVLIRAGLYEPFPRSREGARLYYKKRVKEGYVKKV